MYIHTGEGRIRYTAGTYVYDYYLKDHLGNTRVVFADENTDGTPEILQADNYYPFGMRFGQANTAGKTTEYLYNGKELQEDFNLDWYDYGARFYDPALGRWFVVDPLMEYHFSHTPYHYCFNNPIKFVDPFGMDTTYVAPPIPEIVVEADKPSWWQRFTSWWKSSGTAGSPNESSQASGIMMYSNEGGGYRTTVSRDPNTGMLDVTDLLIYFNYNHHLAPLPKAPEVDVPGGVDTITDLISETDEAIKNATGDKTDAHGKPIDENKTETIKGNESDSIVVPLLHIDMETGDSLVDWKIDKNSRHGRPISEPYFKNKKK